MDLFSVRELLRSRMSPGGTHWGECWRTHVDCAAWRRLEEVFRLELEQDELLADNEQLTAEVEQLRREQVRLRKKVNDQRKTLREMNFGDERDKRQVPHLSRLLQEARDERDEWRKKAEGFRQSWDSLADEMTEVEAERDCLADGIRQ